MKLNRDETYEAIDGPTMDDLTGDAKISFDTSADQIKKLAADSGASVIIWGQVDSGFGLWANAQLKILDLRKKIRSCMKSANRSVIPPIFALPWRRF